MANKKIKGLTVEIGGDTSKLGKALDDIEAKGRNLSSELGEINKMLKFDPSNTELLAQKQKVLSDALTNTRKKLDTLKEAEKQVQAQFERGEVSEEQVRALQREIIATEKKMGSYEKAARETADQLDRLGAEADDAGKEIKDMGNDAKKAENESEDLGETLDGALAAGFTAVIGVATAAAAAVIGCVEASQEYRREMGKLDTAFVTNGHSSEAAKATYEELQSVLGETDQAVEAANHLAMLAEDEEDLRELTDALTGVYATFGASLPIEGLAEAANETAKVGKVTGSFADAINWANTETDDWNEILGDNQKALKAFKKAIKEGEATEDAYTAALEACSDEQERQQLITKTLTKLYKGASDQYKRTNKDVIEANKATEQWNAAVADIGAEMAPVVTSVKEFGVTLLQDAKEPLKATADYIRTKLLPGLSSIASWVLSNGPIIKSTLTAAATGLVALKAATVAAEISQKGFKAAIMATTVAQKALNIAQAATPWGLAAAGAAALIGGLIALGTATQDAEVRVDALTAEERELLESAKETTDALRDQRAATEENIGGIQSHMGHVQNLATELQTLADKSGKVKEADEARVQFILNELNEALGTEYQMVDGVIQKYDSLTSSINEVILAKTANAMLEAKNADYIAALEAENAMWEQLMLAEKDYLAQQEVVAQEEEKLLQARAGYQAKFEEAKTESDYRALASEALALSKKEEAFAKEKRILEDKKTAYDEAALAYGENSEEIKNYEEAQTAALSGNYKRAKEILKGKSKVVGDYADTVDEATARSIDALFKEAVDAGIAAAKTKKNFEEGVEGYTEEMVEESEQAYEDALGAWANAKADAEGLGEDMGEGLSGGLENKRSSLIEKAKSIVQSIFNAFNREADRHSPSKKMIAFGEDLGEGGVIGMEHKTKDLEATARKQTRTVLDAFADEGSSQQAVRSIQAGAVVGSATRTPATTDTNLLGKLDKILSAIEKGQVIALDGDKLVGATIDKFDNKLGQKRTLAARGAL